MGHVQKQMVFPWDMHHPLKHAISFGQVKKQQNKHPKKTWLYSPTTIMQCVYIIFIINQHIHVN